MFQPAVPILRSFDEKKAKEFYVDFLGFTVDFEHRFEPGMPLYMGISQGNCRIHLSEHFGDCAPGARVRIEVADVRSLCASLNAKGYGNARPGWHEQDWGCTEMTIHDPFANRLTFWTATSEGA
jgi:uncharacterized glyoxalase superfamily protein PhnB